jgi:hypothetical protein
MPQENRAASVEFVFPFRGQNWLEQRRSTCKKGIYAVDGGRFPHLYTARATCLGSRGPARNTPISPDARAAPLSLGTAGLVAMTTLPGARPGFRSSSD